MRRALGSFMAGAMMVAPTAGLLMAATPALAKDRFAYEVKESRAYAYKTSLNKTEIEVLNIVIPCDEQTDEYNCDYARYAHEPNCPDKITFGPTGKVPLPKPPKKAEPFKGGAGDSVGGEEPPQGPPVRLNFYLSLASLSRVPGSKDSTGIGAKEYVDLSGAREPNVFTNTDAFTQNQRSYEERCWPKKEAKTGNDFSHVMSRSEKSLHTYHYSECYRRDCTFTAPSPGSLGATAEHARSITDVREVHGRVIGRMSSVVEDLNWGDGAITADSVTSYIKYVADGTPGGLKWEVSSSAQGVKVGGQPVTLPPGTVVSLPNGSSFGMAAPYVDAAKDGSSLTIIHGGLTIATTDQAAFFAGGEVYASFGSSPDDSFNYPDPQPEDNTGIGGGGSIDSGGGLGGGTTDLGGGDITTTGGGGGTGGEEGTAAGPGGELLVFTVATGRGGVTSILVLAGLALLLMASRWVQRFPWGRGLAKVFPFKLIDWIYRAFVKT